MVILTLTKKLFVSPRKPQSLVEREIRPLYMSTYGGDSWAADAKFRHYRVRNLLAESIPEAEYKKLSNGKFVCLICTYGPIFDTLQMLSIHRQGKRHMEEQLLFQDKQQHLKEERRDRIKTNLNITEGRMTESSRICEGTRNMQSPLIQETRKRTELALSSESQQYQSPQPHGPRLSKKQRDLIDDSPKDIQNELLPPALARMKDPVTLLEQTKESHQRILNALKLHSLQELNSSMKSSGANKKDIGINNSIGMYIYDPKSSDNSPSIPEDILSTRKSQALNNGKESHMKSGGGWKRPEDGVAEFESDEEPETFEHFLLRQSREDDK